MPCLANNERPVGRLENAKGGSIPVGLDGFVEALGVDGQLSQKAGQPFLDKVSIVTCSTASFWQMLNAAWDARN